MSMDTILVVDDEPLVFDSIEDTLGDEFQLYYAQNGAVGLKLQEVHHPILILLDIRMPVMDGFEFLKRINLSANDPYSVIVLSAHAAGSEISACYDMGVIAFLRKPFNIFELKGLVKQCVSAKKQYRSLLQEKNFARSIIDYSLSTIIAVDKDRRIMEFNRAAESMYGYSAEEIIGQPISIIYGDGGGDGLVREAMQQNGNFVGEVLSQRKNGESFLVQISATVLRDDKDNVIGSIGSSRDLTEERQAEADRRAREVAQMANQAKSRFLANMSHEIRTPMNAIIGLTRLALKQELPPKLDGYLTKVYNASRALLRLLNDILDFSKIEAGRLELNPEPFDLHDLFERLADLFRQQTFNKKIELSLVIPAQQEFALVGDMLRVEQVLINLIGNAVKFTKDGEIVVRSTLVAQKDDAIHMAFSVRDTGIGIPPDHIEQLFAPFVQADVSHTRKYGGTGLGLAISRQIVEMMGGKIWVESTPGQGSVFHFTLILGCQPSTTQRTLVTPADVRGMKLLVVDDNEVAREIYSNILVAFSFEPVMACSGDEALEKATEAKQAGTPYPLVLMDWRMPEMDGLETSRRMKEISKETHIIMVTAFGRDEVKREAGELGVDLLLFKPLNRAQIFDGIMEVLGQEVSRQYNVRREEADDAEVMEKIGGVRILLVEDNRINQQVAKEILEGVGVIVDIANNGVESLRSVGQVRYDAVLMDLQMPEMDGYEATRRIRRDVQFKELPIIAMTAHALTQDREQCLATGMNDHITKPIEPNELFASLIRWIKPGSRVTPDVAFLQPVTQHDSEQATFPDAVPGINISSGLQRLRGNQTLFLSLLDEFLRDFSSVAHQIRDTLKGHRQNDLSSAANLAHTVKGLAGNVSAETLFEAAAALEKGIKDNQRDNWPVLLDQFENALNVVLDSVRTLERKQAEQQEKEEKTPPTQVVVDPVKRHALLSTLAHLIRHGDSEAEDFFLSVKPYLQDASLANEVKQLEASLGLFDFKMAKASLDVIIGIIGILDINLDTGA